MSVLIMSTQTPREPTIAGGAGEGQTGLAVAKATSGTFAVLGTGVLHDADGNKTTPKLKDNDWLVITGHGQEGALVTTGSYLRADRETGEVVELDVDRSAQDFVNAAMQSGLKKGDHINVALYVCYGARKGKNDELSFAQQVATEFLKRGVTSTVVASLSSVGRQGLNDVRSGGWLPFSTNNEDLVVFSNGILDQEKTMEYSQSGVHFSENGVGVSDKKALEEFNTKAVMGFLKKKAYFLMK